MRIAMSVKNKLGFIDGMLEKPGASDQIALNSWTRNNNMVISWILNSVSREIATSVIYTDSAHEIWTDLRERFQQSNGPRVFQIRREMMTLNQGEDSIGVYYTKLKSLSEELSQLRPICSCGKCECDGVKKYFQAEHVMNLLMGLNETFAQTRAQILLMDPLPPVNRVFSLLAQEENQRTVYRLGQPQSLAFNAAVTQKGQNTQFKNKKERPFCTHCKNQGHTIEKCYKLHGYPPGFKPKTRINQVNVSSDVSTPNKNLHNLVSGFSDDQCQ